MSGGWIGVLAIVETPDVPMFERVLARHVSSLDAIYRPEEEEYLHVELPTEEDEALFRLWMLFEDTADDILRVGDLLYFVAPRLLAELRRCIGQDAFQAAIAPLTAVGLEHRDVGVLRRLAEALDAARPSFAGQPPVLCPV